MGTKKFYQKVHAPGLTGPDKWAGVTNILSGQTVVTVSASQVVSGSAVPHVTLGVTTAASHRAIILSVNSIVANTSFAIVADKATSAGAQQVVYTIVG